MDLQGVQEPSRADKPQQGASSWAQRDHRAQALRRENADLINESRLERSEQWTGSYDSVCVCLRHWIYLKIDDMRAL